MRGAEAIGRILLGAGALGTAAPAVAPAQISPGPLSAPHAALEGSRHCLSCHRPQKGVDPALCMDCHRALAQRVRAGEGLHSRPELSSCERCHSEHNGREFELVFWEGGRESFDHAKTGWRLEGRHVGLRCESCHRPERVDPALRALEPELDPGRTYLGLATACVDCHEDPHRGSMVADSCSACHSQESWKSPRGFDHSTTRFELTGRHATAACATCHKPEDPDDRALFFGQFASAALPDCASCHRDPHAGRLGRDCAACHSTSSFAAGARERFDHDRSAYPLRGRHRTVNCGECHRPGRELRIPGFDRCETCHRDVHAGQLRTVGGKPAACADCHTVDGFRPGRFGPEQHDFSGFPLAAAHRAVPCTACHREVGAHELPVAFGRAAGSLRVPVRRFRFDGTACSDCHRDPHAGALDRFAGDEGCVACHAETRWRVIRFDHARARFPLDGAHARVACAECHPRDDANRMQLTGRPLDCAGCHRDTHAGQLAIAGTTDCRRCHTVERFRPATGFDHQRDARYRIDGAHARVPCAGCHPTETIAGQPVVRYKPLKSACEDCHAPVRAEVDEWRATHAERLARARAVDRPTVLSSKWETGTEARLERNPSVASRQSPRRATARTGARARSSATGWSRAASPSEYAPGAASRGAAAVSDTRRGASRSPVSAEVASSDPFPPLVPATVRPEAPSCASCASGAGAGRLP